MHVNGNGEKIARYSDFSLFSHFLSGLFYCLFSSFQTFITFTIFASRAPSTGSIIDRIPTTWRTHSHNVKNLRLVSLLIVLSVASQQTLVRVDGWLRSIGLSYACCPPFLAHTNFWSIELIRFGDLDSLAETTGQKLSGSWQWGRGTKQITDGIKIFFFFFSFYVNTGRI